MRFPSILLFGQPLIDLHEVVDHNFIKSYNLEPNGSIDYSPSHEALFTVMSDTATKLIGGSSLTTARYIEYINKILDASTQKVSTFFLGTVGDDLLAPHVEALVKKNGVNGQFFTIENSATGTCLVLANGLNRSLVARIGSSSLFSVDHLMSAWKHVEDAPIIYFENYFAMNSPDVAMLVGAHCAKENKVFVLNLSSPNMVRHDRFKEIYAYADIVIGNADEALEYGRVMFDVKEEGVKSLKEVVYRMSMDDKVNRNRPRIVVITQNAEPTLLAYNGMFLNFQVPLVEKSEIVDTNGAGDAFAAGFVDAYAKGQSLGKCVEQGHRLARLILGQVGSSLPE